MPDYHHRQEDILQFMKKVYALPETENRKLKFLYHQSGIETRYSVVPDYSLPVNEWKFYPPSENLEPFPSLEKRMIWYNKHAPVTSSNAINNCIHSFIPANEITHLITVSCTGMSAPGLDLQIMESMGLSKNIYRTSVNFMGCYAAIHGLKMADEICKNDKNAKVIVVCTELCTLHFQRDSSLDSISSGLLFGDGSAAALVVNDDFHKEGLQLKGFYSEVITKGKTDMAWELSSSGFLMTLSGYIPELIEEDFEQLVNKSTDHIGIKKENISHWAIHPGGKRILDAIHRSLSFKNGELNDCYSILRQYGNMSSATILFVLKEMMQSKGNIFGAAFGPGLTMETFIASSHA